ncbi:MAG: PIN domain-containing protein [Solirubrobacterales bacterium]|nr:PIN domain-containing protein [Solirubrobacterales bacterium]
MVEPEAGALREELERWSGYVSSALLLTEAVGAAARYGHEYAEHAREGLKGLSLLPVDQGVLELAAELEPTTLRSLDAIHLATALSLGTDLGVLVAYDE